MHTVLLLTSAHRRMRTVTNYFLVNLSVSDLMMALLNCIFNFIFMLNSHWPFGSFYCTVNNFVANVTVAASVFTLVAISIDRYAVFNTTLHVNSVQQGILEKLHRNKTFFKLKFTFSYTQLNDFDSHFQVVFYSTTHLNWFKHVNQRYFAFFTN